MSITRKFTILFTLALWVLAILPLRAIAAPEDKPEAISVPIVMYHAVTRDTSQLGAYSITPDELEADLRYLQGAGYKTITIRDLIGFVYDGAYLPEKSVVLTFDDGYHSCLTTVLPLLEQYDMRAVFSVVGAYADQYSVSVDKGPSPHLTWKEINRLVDSGRAEVQNHSYNLHSLQNGRRGSMKVSGESTDHYRSVLLADVARMQAVTQANTGSAPEAFTYPFGLVSSDSTAILKDAGFKASLTCCWGVARITHDPDCLFLMKRLIRPHGRSVEGILTAFAR